MGTANLVSSPEVVTIGCLVGMERMTDLIGLAEDCESIFVEKAQLVANTGKWQMVLRVTLHPEGPHEQYGIRLLLDHERLGFPIIPVTQSRCDGYILLPNGHALEFKGAEHRPDMSTYYLSAGQGENAKKDPFLFVVDYMDLTAKLVHVNQDTLEFYSSDVKIVIGNPNDYEAKPQATETAQDTAQEAPREPTLSCRATVNTAFGDIDVTTVRALAVEDDETQVTVLLEGKYATGEHIGHLGYYLIVLKLGGNRDIIRESFSNGMVKCITCDISDTDAP
jgi:hypothetical protein